jgi:cobalt-zinc-cadmium efflux system outer membrane protein
MTRTPRLLSLVLSGMLLIPVAATSAAARDAALGGAAHEPAGEVRSILEKDEITLDDLFRIAERTSPILAAARSGLEAGEGRVRQAGLYPNPVLELEVEDAALEDLGMREDKVSLKQRVIVSGRRGAAIAAARAERVAAGHALERGRREVYARVQSLWVELAHSRSAGEALDELLGTARRTLEIARERFAARAVPESHVTKALLETYDLEQSRRLVDRDRTAAAARLAALLGGTRVPFDRLAGGLDARKTLRNLDDLRRTVIETHPALSAARARIEAARAAHREARARRLPDIDLFVTYGRNAALGDEFVEGGVGLPLPLFDRNQGRVAETRSLSERAEREARAVEEELTADLLDAYQSCETARAQLGVYEEEILPAAERGLAQAQEGYRAGRLPFLDLVDAQRTLASVRLKALALARDLGVAEARLRELTGFPPFTDTE